MAIPATGACPACQHPIRGAVDPFDELELPAKPGDFLVCVTCATCLTIDEGGALREPTTDELAHAGSEQRIHILLAQQAVIGRWRWS